MTPTPVPVALRAYTERRALNTDSAAPPAAPPRKPSARGEPRWPKNILIFDAETTTDETQSLIFGSYRVVREQSDGTYRLIQEGLFYADTLPVENPKAFQELEVGIRHSLNTETRS